MHRLQQLEPCNPANRKPRRRKRDRSAKHRVQKGQRGSVRHDLKRIHELSRTCVCKIEAECAKQSTTHGLVGSYRWKQRSKQPEKEAVRQAEVLCEHKETQVSWRQAWKDGGVPKQPRRRVMRGSNSTRIAHSLPTYALVVFRDSHRRGV